MWKIVVKETFSAAHYLKKYRGRPEPLHGHNYRVEVHIASNSLNDEGITIDFLEVKRYLKSILPDRKFLNDLYDFPTSAENIAREIYRKMKERYPTTVKVVLWETEDMGVEYEEEQG